MNWLVSLFRSDKVVAVKPGVTIRLPDGHNGIVTGGCLHVAINDNHPRRKWSGSITVNLNKLS